MADQDVNNISTEAIDWRIPRPLLYTNSSRTESSIHTGNYERNIRTIYGLETRKPEKLDNVQINIPPEDNWFSTGSSSSSSSRTASSGSLLLSPSNLSSLKKDPITVKSFDTISVASSTHFTLVNGVTVPRKPLSSRQLPALVITMTVILFLGILAAILLIEMRAMELRHP